MYNSLKMKIRIINEISDKGLTKTTFLKNAGLPETTLRNMDTSMPSVEKIAKIADCLDVSVDYLLGREDKKTSKSPSIIIKGLVFIH